MYSTEHMHMGLKLSRSEKHSSVNMDGYTTDDYEEDLLQDKYDNEIDVKRRIFNERYNKDEKAIPFPEDQFEWLKMLNTGFYGQVDLVRDKSTSKELALKVVSKEFALLQKGVQRLKNERRILGSLDHPFIVKMVQSYKSPENLYFLMEYCEGRDMYEYLERIDIVPEDQILFFASQIFLALDFMHGLGVIYRDLKPENIMLNADGYLKLTDMGFAKRIAGRTSSFSCTLEYCAPEVMMQGLKMGTGYGYNKSVDWWSFGVLLYEMAVGRTPFNIKSLALQYYNKILKYPETISTELRDLLANLLQVEVHNRLGCKTQGSNEIKLHAFFKSMDWKKLYFKEIPAPYLPRLDVDPPNPDADPDSESDANAEDNTDRNSASDSEDDEESLIKKMEFIASEFQDF